MGLFLVKQHPHRDVYTVRLPSVGEHKNSSRTGVGCMHNILSS